MEGAQDGTRARRRNGKPHRSVSNQRRAHTHTKGFSSANSSGENECSGDSPRPAGADTAPDAAVGSTLSRTQQKLQKRLRRKAAQQGDATGTASCNHGAMPREGGIFSGALQGDATVPASCKHGAMPREGGISSAALRAAAGEGADAAGGAVNGGVCIGCGGGAMQRDAEDMHAALSNLGYSTPHLHLLVGPVATRASIDRSITHAVCGAAPGSTVVVLCSSHAAYGADGELYILPHGVAASTQHADTLGFGVNKLRSACLRSSAHVLVVMDCCFSGVRLHRLLVFLWFVHNPAKISHAKPNMHSGMFFYQTMSCSSAQNQSTFRCSSSPLNSFNFRVGIALRTVVY